jgi:hypothetical protein
MSNIRAQIRGEMKEPSARDKIKALKPNVRDQIRKNGDETKEDLGEKAKQREKITGKFLKRAQDAYVEADRELRRICALPITNSDPSRIDYIDAKVAENVKIKRRKEEEIARILNGKIVQVIEEKIRNAEKAKDTIMKKPSWCASEEDCENFLSLRKYIKEREELLAQLK